MTANYLQNRSPTKAISVNKTPFEIWFGKQPNLSYIKIFGCQAHVLVQRETRKKLDSHSIEATLLDYCEQSKAYKLLNNDNKNIIISRDVVFNENFHTHQNIVDNEEEEELIDSTFLLVPPTITFNQQPNINTNSFLPTQSLSEQQQEMSLPNFRHQQDQQFHNDTLESLPKLSLEDTRPDLSSEEVESTPISPGASIGTPISTNPSPTSSTTRIKRNIQPTK